MKGRRIGSGTLIVLGLAACGTGGGEAARPAAEIDTLPNGAVRVRNPETGVWAEGEEWRLVEELRIGSAMGAGPDAFGDVIDIEVDPLGRIYVLDEQAQEIRVFDADGGYVRTLARRGAGPGEIENARGMAFDNAGSLWVQDPGNGRYSVFDTTGSVLATNAWGFPGWSYTWDGVFDGQGRLIDRTFFPGNEEFRHGFLVIDPALVAVDTIPLPQYENETYRFDQAGGFSIRPVPFTPIQHSVVDPTGSIWVGVSDAYRIARIGFDGDTTLVVEKAGAPLAVPDETRQEEIRGIEEQFPGAVFDRDRIPRTHPFFQRLAVDESGRLWVEPARTDSGPVVLDVFDPEGRYLGSVSSPVVPAPFRAWRFSEDRIHLVVHD
ncbi:MAG TPA: 6-bladed beta-propeller, partial [Longimicrobiaceae bacterium]|nr:6-bladed beta-propeller [Longimicrobiaceae bacterium]